MVSVGIHKVESALTAGRFDQARKYSAELSKAVPVPKKFNPVEPAKSHGQKSIVLPVEFKAAPVILEGSEEFKLAIQPAQARSEVKELETFKTSVADSVRKTYEQAAKAEKRGFRSLLGFISGFSVVGIIGLIVLCVLFPALLPIVGNLFRLLVSGMNAVLSWFGSILKRKSPYS